jgi:hypothetical protein
MGGVAGVELIYAAKKATAWGTAVACGTLNGFLSRPSGIKEASDVEVDDSLGLYFSGDGSPSAIKCDGDIPAYLRYAGMELLLAMAMGTAGVPVTHAAGTLSKDYIYKPAKHLDGLFITFVKHMKNYIAEVPSLKVTGFTIKGEVGKPLELILNTTGCFINKNTSTGINTLTTANNITIAETGNRVQFAQGVFRMNDQSGIALAAGDQIYPSSFELSFQRKLTGVYGALTTGTTAKRDVIDEPTNDGMPEIGLKLGFPRHTSATMLTALGNDTRKKMDVVFTGGIIETSIPYLFMLQFPHLQIKNVDVVDEQGIIKEPVDFICHSAATAPAGMTGITDPFWISGTNKFATNPLA